MYFKTSFASICWCTNAYMTDYLSCDMPSTLATIEQRHLTCCPSTAVWWHFIHTLWGLSSLLYDRFLVLSVCLQKVISKGTYKLECCGVDHFKHLKFFSDMIFSRIFILSYCQGLLKFLSPLHTPLEHIFIHLKIWDWKYNIEFCW